MPAIGDLAVIGDRRTAAIIGADATALWYSPGRFDYPSLFAGLLDASGGSWSVELPGALPAARRYRERSGVLETHLRTPVGDLVVTDWMPVGDGAPAGLLCRRLSAAPAAVRLVLTPRPDYARGDPRTVLEGSRIHASHPVRIEADRAVITIPQGEAGWAVLADAPRPAPGAAELDAWLAATLAHWRGLARRDPSDGPYAEEIAASLRAIRLLTHEESGGIVAAATTSLPEIIGGAGNWDYRYVWLRDAGMIASALTRLGGDITEGRRYLDFICSSRGSSADYPAAVFTDLEGRTAPAEERLALAGYAGSRPVRIGNDAREQMQLDAFANVLLAAKLVYRHTAERPHWETVEEIAEFLVRHWHEPDHGIWEEPPRRQYTASKIIVACGLASAAEYSTEPAQAARWRSAVGDIRRFVAENCLTAEGAYAAVAGGEDVDVSAALFPVWAYTDAEAPEMRATMAALERDWSADGLLYWRRLDSSESRREGAFLAGGFWVAQYWIMRGELDRARRIIDAGLACANDLGLFSEEADPRTRRLLGNFPQSFVHAAFIGAAIDLRTAVQQD